MNWNKKFSTGVSKEDWKKIKHCYNNKCLECGTKHNLTKDHIIPKCKGGKNNPENIQVLCSKCNLEKAGKLENIHFYRRVKVVLEAIIGYEKV